MTTRQVPGLRFVARMGCPWRTEKLLALPHVPAESGIQDRKILC